MEPGLPHVYVVNFAGHNYSDAERFGELRPVTRGYVSRGSLDRMFFEVVDGLKESSPSDWILPSGMLVLNTLAAVVFWRMHGVLRILVWDQKTRAYRPMDIDNEHIDSLIENLGNGRTAGTEAG